jgi:hypothetical protein
MFKLNRHISEYGIKVEHAICELKCYKEMGTLWRHPRPKLKNLVKICAGFVNRMTNIDTQETDYSVYCQSRKR